MKRNNYFSKFIRDYIVILVILVIRIVLKALYFKFVRDSIGASVQGGMDLFFELSFCVLATLAIEYPVIRGILKYECTANYVNINIFTNLTVNVFLLTSGIFFNHAYDVLITALFEVVLIPLCEAFFYAGTMRNASKWEILFWTYMANILSFSIGIIISKL